MLHTHRNLGPWMKQTYQKQIGHSLGYSYISIYIVLKAEISNARADPIDGTYI